MKTTHIIPCSATLIAALAATTTPSCRGADEETGRFHFPVGIAYAEGIHKATETLYDFYQADGWDVSRVDIPFGLVLNPYYDWNTSFGSIGAGVAVGPTAFAYVDEKISGAFSSDTIKFSYVVPVGPFIRYTPWPKTIVAPYVRAGFKYPIAGGDNFGSSQLGAFGAIGLEFWRSRRVGMSLEVGYDDSRITVKYTSSGLAELNGLSGSRKVTYAGFTVSLCVLF